MATVHTDLRCVTRYMLTSINHLCKEGSAECFKKQNDEQKLVKAFGKGDCFILFPHISPLLGVAFSCHFQYGTRPLGFLNSNLPNMLLHKHFTGMPSHLYHLITRYTLLASLSGSAFVVCRGLRSW